MRELVPFQANPKKSQSITIRLASSPLEAYNSDLRKCASMRVPRLTECLREFGVDRIGGDKARAVRIVSVVNSERAGNVKNGVGAAWRLYY